MTASCARASSSISTIDPAAQDPDLAQAQGRQRRSPAEQLLRQAAGTAASPTSSAFVNAQCGFLSALTPLQPRYAKKIADEDSLMAAIIAQAMGHGNLGMAETSDIPYHVLEETDQQHYPAGHAQRGQ